MRNNSIHNSVCNTTPLLWIKLRMIIGRRVKNISDSMPTGVSEVRLKNGSNLIRGWNRVRRSSIKSDIYSPFISWAIGLPLLSGRVESEVGVPFLVNWHFRCPASVTRASPTVEEREQRVLQSRT